MFSPCCVSDRASDRSANVLACSANFSCRSDNKRALSATAVVSPSAASVVRSRFQVASNISFWRREISVPSLPGDDPLGPPLLPSENRRSNGRTSISSMSVSLALS